MQLLLTKRNTGFNKAKLILEDGTIIEGFNFGYPRSSAGEVVFNTGMVGYPETFTDPSYYGQILVLTYPLIGNYGVPAETKDGYGLSRYFESSKIHIAGLVVNEFCQNYSHWQAKTSLDDWLKKYQIPALSGIDTRALTQKLRERGTMLGKIICDQKIDWCDPNQTNLTPAVSVAKPKVYRQSRKTVVLIDCGLKLNILRELLKRNLSVVRVPWNFDFFKSEFAYSGIVISNGPGDPSKVKETIVTVKKAIKKGIPILGICLGNQILSLAAGAKTYKLKYGHRSQNQPCIEAGSQKCYITTQNHGYAVNRKTLPSGWEPWFFNLNDQTVEGVRHKEKPFLAVQFHPEASPGPQDTSWVFDLFLRLL